MNNDNTRAYIAYTILGSAVLILTGLFFLQVPVANRDMLNFALGNVFGIATTIAGFYFGSSDKKKEEK